MAVFYFFDSKMAAFFPTSKMASFCPASKMTAFYPASKMAAVFGFIDAVLYLKGAASSRENIFETLFPKTEAEHVFP